MIPPLFWSGEGIGVWVGPGNRGRGALGMTVGPPPPEVWARARQSRWAGGRREGGGNPRGPKGERWGKELFLGFFLNFRFFFSIFFKNSKNFYILLF